MRTSHTKSIFATILTIALASASPARGEGMIDGFLLNPTTLPFVIVSQGPCTPGPVTLSWTDPASGQALAKECQHPFFHVIEPLSAVRATLTAPRRREQAEFKFDLVADTGMVRCGLYRRAPYLDSICAGEVQFCFVKTSRMLRRLAPAVVELSQESGERNPMLIAPGTGFFDRDRNINYYNFSEDPWGIDETN